MLGPMRRGRGIKVSSTGNRDTNRRPPSQHRASPCTNAETLGTADIAGASVIQQPHFQLNWGNPGQSMSKTRLYASSHVRKFTLFSLVLASALSTLSKTLFRLLEEL